MFTIEQARQRVRSNQDWLREETLKTFIKKIEVALAHANTYTVTVELIETCNQEKMNLALRIADNGLREFLAAHGFIDVVLFREGNGLYVKLSFPPEV